MERILTLILKGLKTYFLFPYYTLKTYEKLKNLSPEIQAARQNEKIHEKYYLHLKFQLNALISDEPGVMQIKRNPQLIVSLTTFEPRIANVFLVIESILSQSIKADRIILWLAKEVYNDDNIPYSLKKLKKRGLEIKYCRDIKSYKKLIYALKEFPQDVIVTADDDLFYHQSWLEELYNAYLMNPTVIHTHRARLISFKKSGELCPYSDWKLDYNMSLGESFLCFPTTGGGVIYPPDSFHEEVLNEDLFTSLAPTADDVWFYAMTLLKGRKSKKITHNFRLISIRESDKITLWSVNQFENDKQIKATFSHFSLEDKLRSLTVHRYRSGGYGSPKSELGSSNNL